MSDEAVIERVQSILINAAEGRRSIGDDAQYDKLRRELIRRPFSTPQLVSTHPTVDSFGAFIRGISDRRERVKLVRDQFEPLFQPFADPPQSAFDASEWGASPSQGSRLKTVRSLLPLAQAAVDSMITTLSEPNPNGAPMMEHKKEAIEHLRELHRTLGELLAVVDAEGLDAKGQRLLAEAAGYAKRAARSLRDDPMPYLASALLLGIFEACGLPGIAAYLVGITQNITKHSGKPAE
jgi:hypothetical protein